MLTVSSFSLQDRDQKGPKFLIHNAECPAVIDQAPTFGLISRFNTAFTSKCNAFEGPDRSHRVDYMNADFRGFAAVSEH